MISASEPPGGPDPQCRPPTSPAIRGARDAPLPLLANLRAILRRLHSCGLLADHWLRRADQVELRAG